MRILAISDIHGHLQPIERLISLEQPRFDALIVAGDISGLDVSARDVLAPLAYFECPILYVYGNWDHKLSYDEDLGIGQHLHGRAVTLENYTFVGFSGCDSNWGRNPISVRLQPCDLPIWHKNYTPPPRPIASNQIMRENIESMTDTWKQSGALGRRTVAITHDRCYRLGDYIPGIALHTFGHRHGFKCTTFRGSVFANVSAMDMGYWIIGGKDGDRPIELIGNYTVIELSDEICELTAFDLYENQPR